MRSVLLELVHRSHPLVGIRHSGDERNPTDVTEVPMNAIEVSRLRKTYPGGVEAVREIDFEVAPGEVFGLLGPNGAGKSTTIGVLTTTIAPTGGSARVGGYDVVAEPRKARLVSSVVFQDPVVDRGFSGGRNLELHGRLWGVDRATAAERAGELVDLLGLAELVDRPVASYSGGQRRRLEIARALVSEPRLLFLDEPTVGLDPRIRNELLDVIASIRERTELTILVTTHYLEEAERLCDRIAIMHAGRIVALDTPAALLAALGREILELRTAGDAAGALASLRARGIAGPDAYVVGSTLTVPLHDRPGADARAAVDDLGLVATGVSTRPPTLDDVYLRLTGDRLAEAA
jgi:ABC-2 type transport system ATP-binding protein